MEHAGDFIAEAFIKRLRLKRERRQLDARRTELTGQALSFFEQTTP